MKMEVIENIIAFLEDAQFNKNEFLKEYEDTVGRINPKFLNSELDAIHEGIDNALGWAKQLKEMIEKESRA